MSVPKCLENYDQLRKVPPPSEPHPCEYIFVAGSPDPLNSGIQGFFEWRPHSKEDDNSGTVIKPNSLKPTEKGRWHRVFDGAISVKWFGAKGDGEMVLDGSIAAKSNKLNSASGKFVQNDVGKLIAVEGAGAPKPLCTVIEKYISANQVKLLSPAINPVTNALTNWHNKTSKDSVITAAELDMLTSASGMFTKDDEGTSITVESAGPAGMLRTKISSFSNATEVILGDLALFAMGSTATVIWGTDDTAAMGRALNAAKASSYGHLYLPSGIYTSSASLNIDFVITISGEGRGSIVRAFDDSFHVFMVMGEASGSSFSRFQIQGGAISTTGKLGQFAIFSVTDQASIPTNITIEHLLITGPSPTIGCNNGILLDTGASEWTISHNYFERLIGIDCGGGYGILTSYNTQRNMISNNRFIGGVGQGRHALYLSGSASYNIVAHNIVKDFNQAAFPIYSANTDPLQACQYNQILENTIIGGGLLGTDSGAIEIDGNSSYNRVAGNIIVGHQAFGIVVSDAGQGGLCIGNEVAVNSIYNVAFAGIAILGAQDTDVRSNKVCNASLSSPGTYAGIDISSSASFGKQVCNGTKVIGNTSWGTSQRFAFAINPSLPAPTNTIAVGNVFLAGPTSPSGVVAGHDYELSQIDSLFISNASNQKQSLGGESDGIDFHLSRTASLDFPTISAGATVEISIPLVGVSTTGWAVTATPEGAPEAGLMWSAYVSAQDTVSLRLANVTTGVNQPASRVFRVQAWKY